MLKIKRDINQHNQQEFRLKIVNLHFVKSE